MLEVDVALPLGQLRAVVVHDQRKVTVDLRSEVAFANKTGVANAMKVYSPVFTSL